MTDLEKYQIAISFAGQQRAFASELTRQLQARGVTVFYDEDHLHELWGKNLTEELHRIYSSEPRYVIMLISSHYVTKVWTRHERRAALQKHIRAGSEYILPVKFDESWPEGLSADILYLAADAYSPAQIAGIAARKLGVPQPEKASHVPPPQLASSIGTAEFDPSDHDGRYVIGQGRCAFEIKWQLASSTLARAYNDPPSIDGVAFAAGAASLTDITDASTYNFTSRTREAHVGEFLIARNTSGIYAAIKIEEIRNRFAGAENNCLKFFYVIAEDGSTDFSSYGVFE